ncbi:NAD(P)-dependent alcohol dehydrogenase [Blastococcus sp. CT_GayMR20]|uniref:NAD(P)-dependent alcohol dehydrogenase n=1 Tax=Blastococcus sp. CT_GayMR20 TaxID=2559609 RepID=UPI001073471E|nr:NAD(P)-dependent alcohol dehydrogenase [Blastococcus sp. CT_GayMR20]TFV75053.1 NAD(P)-dependent alcohol dehydrogenase [Blastococcus sp. CT_GayMR20]
MRAIVQEEYGPTEDVLRLGRLPRPEIGAGEVLVRVRAAGVDRGVWHLMAGEPYAIRLAGFGVRAPKNAVRGSEFAGVVEAVAPDVTTLRAGDEVYGIGRGSFAEYVVAPVGKVAPKPAGLSFEQAAAAPVSASTALQAVRDHGGVRPGQSVLVIGASGGVGSFAVQIAKAFGAEVTGVSSTSKVDLVRSLGADRVLDYSAGDFLAGEERYDVVLDIGGNTPLRRLRRALTPTGTLVIVGGETGGRWLGVRRQLLAVALSPFVGQKLGTFINSENAADLVVLTGLLEAGTVVPAVDRVFPLAEAAAAVRWMREGRARGKVVVAI